ncbi:BQ5605_C021g09293 [Microbotryum silenes-dioicae]|uniref:BQ5605_C021g09293 protein n=1 Tax=Microbotryum silenes-dioicae TaxID=796604 RepID=A0A2X0MK90_9BASI|nr:BQ5605_C021g09293 [Microbotryum silenes-dioicae]
MGQNKPRLLKCTYKAYGLDPERLPAAAAEKATLYLQNTRWAASVLKIQMLRLHFPPQGGSDPDHCAFEPEEDLQNVYDIVVQIVAGIMRDRSAAFQWPEQGLDHNNDDHRELAFALVTRAYAGTKQTVSLWHEFSATHYQGHVQFTLRRRRREGRGAPYSDAVQVRVTNRVQCREA